MNFDKVLIFIKHELFKPTQEQVILPKRCLSFPGFNIEVMHPESIHMKYTDLERGTLHENSIVGGKARLIMSENDHSMESSSLAGWTHPKKFLEPVLKKLKEEQKFLTSYIEVVMAIL